jgi:hypothetical protein
LLLFTISCERKVDLDKTLDSTNGRIDIQTNRTKQKFNSIRDVDFCNFTFKNVFGEGSHCIGAINQEVAKNGEVTVIECEYTINQSPKSYNTFDYRFSVDKSRIIYGDITDDNKEEAIIKAGCSAPGLWQDTHEEAYVYLLKDSEAIPIGIIDWGAKTMGGFKDISIKDNKIYVERYENENFFDNPDKPTYINKQIYKWDGKKLGVVSEKKLNIPPK